MSNARVAVFNSVQVMIYSFLYYFKRFLWFVFTAVTVLLCG